MFSILFARITAETWTELFIEFPDTELTDNAIVYPETITILHDGFSSIDSHKIILSVNQIH